jgi:hypothetical protein
MGEGQAVSDQSPGGNLVLRHARFRTSGTWGPEDYDVLQDGRDIGRIFYGRRRRASRSALYVGDYRW